MMRAKFLIAFVLLLLTGTVFADERLIDSAAGAQIRVTTSGTISIIRNSERSRVISISAAARSVPKDDFRQSVISTDTLPGSKDEGSARVFTWEDPKEETLSYSITSEVRTRKAVLPVKSRIAFPYSGKFEGCDSCELFLEKTENIDPDPKEMITKASEILRGEDDYFRAVFKLAYWVYDNVEYDLAYGSEVKDSSWVLRNLKGTCDEKSTLFIAMLRSVGIPARYVSGIAYSNLPEIDGFGPHGWAEAYFPGYGWVPFDPTYGQFGIVDSSHVKTMGSSDTSEASLNVSWKGVDCDLELGKIKTEGELVSESGKFMSDVELSASFLKSEVGFGSYNLLTIELKNKNDFYFVDDINLVLPVELSMMSESSENNNFREKIVLGPGEKKKIYKIMILSEDLMDNYRYTFPIKIYEGKNIAAEAEFFSTDNARIYLLDDIRPFAEEAADGKVSMNIYAECSSLQEAYVDEKVTIRCTVENTGNTLLDGLSACLKDDCKRFFLGIGKSEGLTFDYVPKAHGEDDLIMKVTSADVSRNVKLKLLVNTLPEVMITNISYPKSVGFRQHYSVSFVVKQSSFSAPKSIVVRFSDRFMEKVMDVSSPEKENRFEIELDGTSLRDGDNRFVIEALSTDKNNRTYSTEEEFYITTQASLWDRVMMMFYSLFSRYD